MPPTPRISQGDAPVLGSHSDHTPVWAVFDSEYIPHPPAELIEELVFEDTWHLEVRQLSVTVNLGSLRDADGGWGHLYGDRWLGTKPPLHASIGAGCLSRGLERLPAPLPPGTIVQGRGGSLKLSARWDASHDGRGGEVASLPLTPLASQLGLAWLRHDALTLHVHAGDATPHVPLGSARFALAASIDRASADPSPGNGRRRSQPSSGGSSGRNVPDSQNGVADVDTPSTSVVSVSAPLIWCGVHCGDVRLTFAIRLAADALTRTVARRTSNSTSTRSSLPSLPCQSARDTRGSLTARDTRSSRDTHSSLSARPTRHLSAASTTRERISSIARASAVSNCSSSTPSRNVSLVVSSVSSSPGAVPIMNSATLVSHASCVVPSERDLESGVAVTNSPSPIDAPAMCVASKLERVSEQDGERDTDGPSGSAATNDADAGNFSGESDASGSKEYSGTPLIHEPVLEDTAESCRETSDLLGLRRTSLGHASRLSKMVRRCSTQRSGSTERLASDDEDDIGENNRQQQQHANARRSESDGHLYRHSHSRHHESHTSGAQLRGARPCFPWRIPWHLLSVAR